MAELETVDRDQRSSCCSPAAQETCCEPEAKRSAAVTRTPTAADAAPVS